MSTIPSLKWLSCTVAEKSATENIGYRMDPKYTGSVIRMDGRTDIAKRVYPPLLRSGEIISSLKTLWQKFHEHPAQEVLWKC